MNNVIKFKDFKEDSIVLVTYEHKTLGAKAIVGRIDVKNDTFVLLDCARPFKSGYMKFWDTDSRNVLNVRLVTEGVKND